MNPRTPKMRISSGDAIIAGILSVILLTWAGLLAVWDADQTWTAKTLTFHILVDGPILACLIFLLMTEVRWWKALWALCLLAVCGLAWVVPWHPRLRFFQEFRRLQTGISREQLKSLAHGFQVSPEGPERRLTNGVGALEALDFQWTSDGPYSRDRATVYLRFDRVESVSMSTGGADDTYIPPPRP